MYGRPLLGKGFLAALACGLGAVMYPACRRGRKTAGHDGLRGSGSGIAARSRGAMTKRSIPTQVLTLVPSLPFAPCPIIVRSPPAGGRTAASPVVGGLRPSELRTSRSADWSWLRLLLRLWVTHRRYPQPIRLRRFCEAARSRLRPGSPRRCGRSWPPAPAPPPSPAGGRGCRAAIPLRDRCASGRCA